MILSTAGCGGALMRLTQEKCHFLTDQLGVQAVALAQQSGYRKETRIIASVDKLQYNQKAFPHFRHRTKEFQVVGMPIKTIFL
jgi:hypothetical protein